MPSPLDHPVAHGVHPAMKGVQAPCREAPVDLVDAQPELDELPSGDHPVLPAGQLGQGRVRGSVRFTAV